MKIDVGIFKVNCLGIVFLLDALIFGLGFPFLMPIRLGFYFLLLILLPPKKRSHLNSSVGIIACLLALILILSVFNTSNVLISLDSAVKTCFSLMLYIYAFFHVNSSEKLIRLSKFAFIALGLSLFCIALSNIFKFGEVNYRDSSVLFGASGVNFSKHLLLYSLLSLPYIIYESYKKQKILAYVLFSISALLVILSTKRTAMLLLGVYIFLYFYFNKKTLLKNIVPLGLIIIVSVFFFQDLIIERIENRSARFELNNDDEIEKEWRYHETLIVLENFNSGEYLTKFLGEETFNEVKAYNLPLMFHNDFAVLLGGTGLVGFSLYFLFLFRVSFWYIKKKYLIKLLNLNLYQYLFVSLLLGVILFGVSGNFKVLGGSLSISLVGLAAIQSVVMNEFKLYSEESSIEKIL